VVEHRKIKPPTKPSKSSRCPWTLCSISREVIKKAREQADNEGKNPKLAEHAAMIRRLGERALDYRKKAIEDIIHIGWRLREAKKLVEHGDWAGWLEKEFGWSADTALNFMRVYDLSESRNFRDLNIAPSALYLLAAPSTPPAVKDEIIERAEAGEKITVKTTKELLKKDQPTVVEGLQPAAKGKAKDAAERNNRREAARILEITNELIQAAKFARPGAIRDPKYREEVRAHFLPLLSKWREGREAYSWIIDDLCGGGQEPPAQTEAA